MSAAPRSADGMRAMERFADPSSFATLEATGIRPGWRCLELGGGGGSVAHWLADRCRPGEVIVTDRDTSLLPGEISNLTVMRHDAAREEFPPESFDLLHARALVEHLPNRDDAITRMARWVVPGGWVCVDGVIMVTSSARPLHALHRCMAAMEAVIADWFGVDSRWAMVLPHLLAKAGLVGIQATCTPGIVGGSSPASGVIKHTLETLRPTLIGGGRVGPDDVDAAIKLLDDDGFRDSAMFLYSARGRRPPTRG